MVVVEGSSKFVCLTGGRCSIVIGFGFGMVGRLGGQRSWLGMWKGRSRRRLSMMMIVVVGATWMGAGIVLL